MEKSYCRLRVGDIPSIGRADGFLLDGNTAITDFSSDGENLSNGEILLLPLSWGYPIYGT